MFCFVFFQKFRLPIGLHSSCSISPSAGGTLSAKYHNWLDAPQCISFQIIGTVSGVKSLSFYLMQLLTYQWVTTKMQAAKAESCPACDVLYVVMWWVQCSWVACMTGGGGSDSPPLLACDVDIGLSCACTAWPESGRTSGSSAVYMYMSAWKIEEICVSREEREFGRMGRNGRDIWIASLSLINYQSQS